MSDQSKPKMMVDEFLLWAEDQQGRWELFGGVPYAMAPERVRHGQVKFAVQTALKTAIGKAGLDCHMLPDGATVRVSENTAYEPDALVYCGAALPGDAVEVPDPVIIVEVASPSTRRIDASLKLAGYFTLPSLCHYLIINPDAPPLIHHARQDGDTITTHIVADGVLNLVPPGLEIAVADLFSVD